jgi:nucleoside-diphosphate-sugar epimerase
MTAPSLSQKPLHILVVGASQGTGALAVKRALERGHVVTAFSRNPDKLGIEHPNLRKHPGDFHMADSVASAMTGQDAVIVTASASSLKALKENPSFFASGTRNVVDAMKATKAKRIVILSAIGVGESKKLMP